MTETEARLFIKRLEDLCAEFERDCKSRIDFQLSEKRQGARAIKWITIENISLKIDK